MLRILFFGDIVGRVGREAITKVLPEWRGAYEPNLIIANGENIAHGKGVSRDTLKEILDAGVEVVTTGNHIWSFPEAHDLLQEASVPLLRPANFTSKLPGKGFRVFDVGVWRVLVVNLMGQAAMHQHLNSPFEKMDEILEEYGLPGDADGKEMVHVIFVDWHAELTSEKLAMGWYLDGRVSAVLGTHTHVPTADERILPKGTALQADAGMVGAHHSILGVEVESNLRRFLLQVPGKIPPEEQFPAEVNGALVTVDTKTGLATDIKRLRKIVEKE